jgi:hypothetical protein
VLCLKILKEKSVSNLALRRLKSRRQNGKKVCLSNVYLSRGGIWFWNCQFFIFLSKVDTLTFTCSSLILMLWLLVENVVEINEEFFFVMSLSEWSPHKLPSERRSIRSAFYHHRGSKFGFTTIPLEDWMK